MKGAFRYISHFIFAIWGALCLGACIYDNYPDSEEEINTGVGSNDQMLLVLHISPLDAANSSSSVNTNEKIKSLRIIILGKDTLECNKLVTFSSTAVSAYFNYIFTWPTVPGNKEVYLIANEESVTNIQYGDASINDYSSTLSGLLELYKDSEPHAKEFRSLMKSVYFSPQYEKEPETGNIYLPYTSYYEIEAEKEKHLEQTAYLVPVATKFTFKFINKRENPVEVSNISITEVNSDNFLFASVEDTDCYKVFVDDNKKYYWIDWLAKVAEASHSNEDYGNNEVFNERYGWILGYKMPTEITEVYHFIKSNIQIKGKGDAATATPYNLGPFYVPESRYNRTFKDAEGNTVTEQAYGLTLELKDATTNEQPSSEFEDVIISNLKALFRNTSVVITITMSEGSVEVYAEIEPWVKQSIYGWVEEGTAPPNSK